MSGLSWLWLVPALPFVGFLLNGLLGRRLGRGMVRAVACGVMLAAALVTSFLVALPILGGNLGDPGEHGSVTVHDMNRDGVGDAAEIVLWQWIEAGAKQGQAPAGGGQFLSALSIPFGFHVDGLTVVMMLVITWIGFLIHVYASSYMWDDDGYWRFFAYLNLFVSMMLILVMGSSFVMMFVGWEGVGLCSYLLIGFYFKQEVPPTAGMKAFLVNRVGDFGFLLGMLLLMLTFGSLRYSELIPRVEAAGGYVGTNLALLTALLLFVGACGKSAQLPLHVWLPDAMAGPTPVSALIHAATMVTAGVYLVIRGNAIFQASPTASLVIAVVGVATALLAATIALVQNDLKKILAYSTVSQLGYMFLAVGTGAYVAGLFHLVTHAFFKALLFLGAGSVSHGLHGELDIRKMGGLKKVMPHTHRVMLVATLAIAGFPGLSGFFSKDEILASAVGSAFGPSVVWALWGAGILTAVLTSFYMFRLYFRTFSGEPRWSDGVHAHESPWLMLGPLYVLAFLSVVGGFLNLPHYITHTRFLEAVISPCLCHAGALLTEFHVPHGLLEAALVAAAVGAFALGLFLAWSWYAKGSETPQRLAERHSTIHGLLSGKWRIDEIYAALFVEPFRRLCDWASSFDRWVVDGLVELTGIGTTLAGEIFRHVSSGRVRTYALAVFIGAVGLTLWLMSGRGISQLLGYFTAAIG
ncbi:MAG: NADH-quinone oxidoreductase subunit L [Acidobacteriota bacterium]